MGPHKLNKIGAHIASDLHCALWQSWTDCCAGQGCAYVHTIAAAPVVIGMIMRLEAERPPQNSKVVCVCVCENFHTPNWAQLGRTGLGGFSTTIKPTKGAQTEQKIG